DRQCQVIPQARGDGQIWKHPPAVLHKQANRFLADIPTAVSYSHVGVVRKPLREILQRGVRRSGRVEADISRSIRISEVIGAARAELSAKTQAVLAGGVVHRL